MPIIHAVILGITQGLSEFLPISSSGHLILVPWLFGWNDFANNSVEKAFDVALHIGTLTAAVAYFRRDLVVYGREGVRAIFNRRERATPEGRLAWLLVLSALPAAAVGAVFNNTIDEHLGRIPLIAVSLIVFGLLLAWADRLPSKRAIDDYGPRDALVVGAAQALALNPGTSRSGITITAARYRGLTRDSAARISFLMSIPIIGGAGLYKGAKLFSHGGIPSGLGAAFAWGTIASAVTGFIAIWGVLRILRTRSFTPFVIYRLAAGALVLGVAALRG
jgi:undecaprenyl-diphosphatase